jgi:hypothetical protein
LCPSADCSAESLHYVRCFKLVQLSVRSHGMLQPLNLVGTKRRRTRSMRIRQRHNSRGFFSSSLANSSVWRLSCWRDNDCPSIAIE